MNKPIKPGPGFLGLFIYPAGEGRKPKCGPAKCKVLQYKCPVDGCLHTGRKDDVITHLKGAAVFVGENPAKASIDQARECTEIKAENKGIFFGVQAKNKICYIIYTPASLHF